MHNYLERGFTLIELLIAFAIFAFLVVIAGPQYFEFMANIQIRNGAENTLAGVRKAQAEAVRSNTQVQFTLDPTACTGGWSVTKLNDETGAFDVVESYSFADGACKTTAAPTPADATKVTFNGLGRVIPNVPVSSTLKWIQITNPSLTTPRDLRVVINPATATGVKLCDPDPSVVATDARYCPAT